LQNVFPPLFRRKAVAFPRWHEPDDARVSSPVLERGFGFICRDDGGTDVSIHISEVTKAGLRTLNPGDRVAFALVAGRAGREQAADLRLLDEAA
jgi:CspA family cold shock protein